MSKYKPGDYIKVEFDGKNGEWGWMRIERADDRTRVIVCSLDNVPLTDYGGQLRVGSRLIMSYDKIRGHKKSGDSSRYE